MFSIAVRNTGSRKGDEVVQVYARYPLIERMPYRELKYFKRVSLQPGQSQQLTCKIPLKQLKKWNSATHQWQLFPGDYSLIIGSNSLDERMQISFTIPN